MPSSRWNRLPDPCLLTIFNRFTNIELLCTIRLVCKRWSVVASPKINQRPLVIGCWYELTPQYVQYLTPSVLLKHVRHEEGQAVKYRSPIYDRSIVKYTQKIRFRKPFVTVLLKNFLNITKLTLVLGNVDKSVIFADCELSQLIRLLTYLRKNLITLNLSMLDIQHDERRIEPNVETLFNTINRLSSLQNLSFNLRSGDKNSVVPELTILPQLKTFNFAVQSQHNFRMKMLELLESWQFSELCEIGYEARYWSLREEYKSELDKIARVDAKFCNLSVRGELDLNCYKNLQLICSKFISLQMLDVSIDGAILMNKLARCLSQLPQLIHLKLCIQRYQIPQEDTPIYNIARVRSVRLLTLDIETLSHHDTAQLNIAHIFPNLQVLDLWHSSKICNDCDYNYHNVRYYEFEDMDKVIKPEDQIRIAQCMHKAKEPFRACVQLHTVELNDGPFRFSNRNLVSKEEYFSDAKL